MPQDLVILPGYIPIGIHGNHMDMTKFVNVKDPEFVAICGELRQWVRDTDINKRHHTNQPPANQSDAASQHGDNARQYNLFNESTQKITDGHYFEAKEDQNFGMIPPKDSKEKNKAKQRLKLQVLLFFKHILSYQQYTSFVFILASYLPYPRWTCPNRHERLNQCSQLRPAISEACSGSQDIQDHRF